MKKIVKTLITSLFIVALVATAFPAGAAKYEGVKVKVLAQPLTFWEAMEPFIPEFEKETGISVSITYYPEIERRSKSRLDASTGTGAFQVYHVDEQNVPEFANAGWLVL